MRRRALVLLIVACLSWPLLAQTYSAPGQVKNSQHDFSITSTGSTYKATSQTQICAFCHTPHNANPTSPLWNHALTSATYTLYSSSTLTATMAQPGSSDSTKLCLSCHDGTVALGNTVNNGNIAMANGVTTLPATAGTTYSPPRNTDLTTNLSSDHPTAFTPTFPVLPAYPQVQNPLATTPVQLESGKMQCVSCHNPHQETIDGTERRFLRVVNSGAAICITCHKWQGSAGGVNAWNWNSGPSSDHMTKTNTYNMTTNDPGDSNSSVLGSHTGYTTTATNGCESCHRPHNAFNAPRLLKGTGDTTSGSAQVCFQCHNGNTTTNIINPPTNTAVQNIRNVFTTGAYVHPGSTVAGSSGATDAGHDPAETLPINTTRHAACDDCHNPHAAKGYESGGAAFPIAPNMPSTLWGVGGVTKAGTSRNRTSGSDNALYQYEICLKCHADSTNKPQTSDVSITGIGYTRMPLRMSDFTSPTNCSTAPTTRANKRLQFTTSASYHPVVNAMNSSSTYENNSTVVPSLMTNMLDINGVAMPGRTLSSSTNIYCTDCHNNNAGRDTVYTRLGPAAGPHSSSQGHLVERSSGEETATTACNGGNSNGGGGGGWGGGGWGGGGGGWGGGGGGWNGGGTGADMTAFATCAKCHDLSFLAGNDTSFGKRSNLHAYHLNLGAACDTCHDPHGSSNKQLVNFDKWIVGPSSYNNNALSFTDNGVHAGTCNLTCHGKDHGAGMHGNGGSCSYGGSCH